MNYGQLKENIVNLGFADTEELEELGTVVTDSINRAIKEINLNYSPIISKYTIEQDGSIDGLLSYSMPYDFLKFADVPVKQVISDGVYQRFDNYEIDDSDNSVLIDGSYVGTFALCYVSEHDEFTLETPDDEDIPLPLKTHHLVPLLASYYVWLDDDMTKAEKYYENYQQEVIALTQDKNKPRVRFSTKWGGI